MTKVNELSESETERLAVTLEECGEAIHMIGKTLRHGFYSTHPDYGGITNRENLTKELGDVQAAIEILIAAGDVVQGDVHMAKVSKLERLQQFFHTYENRNIAIKLANDYV